MASPQVENGHIDIANELAEALAGIRISGEEYQCLWVIIRKTYGWHKKQDAISLSQFVEMTGINKPNVVRAIKRLLSKKIITVIYNDNATATTYGINKDYQKWQSLSKKITLSKKIIIVIKKDNASLSKKIHTKETTTKEKKENNTPEFISPNVWDDFIQHRRSLKAPLTRRACELIFKKLEGWKEANGWSPDDVLNQSIEKGWKGIFELEVAKKSASQPAGKKCHKEWVPPK